MIRATRKDRSGKMKRRSLKILITAAVIIAILASGLYIYLNYFSLSTSVEAQLRDQFGDEFFGDFNDLPEPDDSEADFEAVLAKYEPLFTRLEERAVTRLEELFQLALKEYDEQKKTGTFDRVRFTNKYIQAGRLLENQVDEAFNSLLGRMENELKRKELPTDIIDDIMLTYDKAKEDKKNDIFNRLREKLDR